MSARSQARTSCDNTGHRHTGVLVVVGDLVEDVVVWLHGAVEHATDNPAFIHRARGGSAANVAAGAAPHVPTRFIGRVGRDHLGDHLARQMRACGAEVRLQREGRTGSVVILVHPGGERTMLPDRAAAAELSGVPRSWLAGTRVLHVPAYSLAGGPAAAEVRSLIAVATSGGADLTMDASSTHLLQSYGVERFLAMTRCLRPAVLFANASEARLLGLDRIRPHPGGLFVVRDGPRPARIIRSSGDAILVPAPPVTAVRDSTGAGDAFTAGYLVAHLRSAGPVDAVRSGHRFARAVLSFPGAGGQAGPPPHPAGFPPAAAADHGGSPP